MHRRLWALAGPMILSNLTVPLLGMVDTAVVGHLESPRYLAAVGLGATIFSFLFWGFGFLRMGTTGLTAQAAGAGDDTALRLWLARGLLLALLLGCLLLMLQAPLWRLAMGFAGIEGELAALTADYFNLRIWSAPAALANYVLLGWFLGLQNARIPLLLLLAVNGLNIVLDVLFVWGLGWRVEGVAFASLLADWFGLGLGGWFAVRLLKPRVGGWDWPSLWDRAALGRMLHLNTDIFIRTLCLLFAFAFFSFQGARLGELMLAVNVLLMNFQTLMAYALDGFAHAAEALVGHALGARKRRLLRQALFSSLIWSLGFAALFSLAYLLFGEGIIGLLTSIPQLQAAAAEYLPWLVLSPLLSVWSFWLDGVFIGATRSRAMRNAMLAVTLGVFLPLWYISQPLGNHGLWLALMGFMLARGIALGLVLWSYRSRGGLLAVVQP